MGPPDPAIKNNRPLLVHDGDQYGAPSVYGWQACNARRLRDEKNSDLADCLTFLAQAIYLQIQGKDTFWSTGQVDPKTLKPREIK